MSTMWSPLQKKKRQTGKGDIIFSILFHFLSCKPRKPWRKNLGEKRKATARLQEYGTKQLNPTKLSTSITLHHITHSSSPTTNMMDMGLVNTSCGLIWKEGGSGESYGGPKSTKISLFK